MKEYLRNINKIQINPFIIAVIGCLLLYVLFPGDIPWINDEPMLIRNALEANAQHTLAKSGLRGSVGMQYGPLPIWFYQLLLVFSKNPVHLGIMKNILSFIALTCGLIYFSHRMKLSPWPLFLVLLSPYVYFYNRQLWDNVFMIPLSLFLWCSALSFWLYKNRWAFVVGIVLCVILVHIHLMAMLTIVPFGLIIITFDSKWLRRNLYFVLFWIFMAILTSLPYLLSLDTRPLSFSRSYNESLWHGTWSVFTGARFLSFVGFGDYFIPEIFGPRFFLPKPLTYAVVFLTAFIFIPWIFGLFTSVGRLIRKIKQRDDWDTEDRLIAFALFTILFCMFFFTLTRQHHQPHYFNSVWFSYFYLIWRWLDNIIRKSSTYALRILGFHGAIIGFMLVLLILFIHVNGGNRGIHYGPTLSNQIRVARSLLKYSHLSRIYNAVPNYNYFPHALYTLIELFRSDKSTPNLPIRQIYIHHNKDPNKGLIYLNVSDQPVSLQQRPEDLKG